MNTSASTIDRAVQERWLKRYYFTRAAFSVAWILAALGPGRQSPFMASLLLVMYPAWDALANLADGSRSGGLARNRSAMALSGAQSALAGAFFIYQAGMPAMPSIATVVGYAGFGAFYFLVSALWLSTGGLRRKSA
jgi:hypothetical protein